jgi:hypothetical protein
VSVSIVAPLTGRNYSKPPQALVSPLASEPPKSTQENHRWWRIWFVSNLSRYRAARDLLNKIRHKQTLEAAHEVGRIVQSG